MFLCLKPQLIVSVCMIGCHGDCLILQVSGLLNQVLMSSAWQQSDEDVVNALQNTSLMCTLQMSLMSRRCCLGSREGIRWLEDASVVCLAAFMDDDPDFFFSLSFQRYHWPLFRIVLVQIFTVLVIFSLV